MTTGVDIFFKELPAQARTVDRERKPSPSPVRADNADDRSKISNYNDDRKAVKTFTEHLDDHNIKNDGNRKNDNYSKNTNDKTDVTQQPDNKNTETFVNKPEQTNKESTVTSEIPVESKIQEPIRKIVNQGHDILFSEKLPENPPPTAIEHSAVINAGVKNVGEPSVASNQPGANITNPALVVANINAEPNVQKSIPAVANPKAAKSVPTDKTQTADITIAAPATVEATNKGEDLKNTIKSDLVVTEVTKDVEITRVISPKEIVHQNGLGTDDKLFTQSQKSDDAQPVNIKTSPAPQDGENKITTPAITAEKTDTPAEKIAIESPVKVALPQQIPLEKTLPEEAAIVEKRPVTVIAAALNKNDLQRPTAKVKNTGIIAGKGNKSSSSQQKPGILVSNNGQATQAQQATPQNTVKNDVTFDLGLTAQKMESVLPQPLNINGQSSLATGGLLAVQDVNIQKSIGNLTSTIKSETAAQAKMVNEQITIAVSKNILKGQNHFNIRLKPADLGQVEIRIEFLADGKMQASMMVENEKTLSMLQRDQSVLEKALQDAGINLSNKNMNFSLMKQDQQQSQKFAGFNNPANDDGSFEDMAPTETLQEIRMGYSNRAIDISV